MPRVIHFEISSDNPERANKFYADVFGVIPSQLERHNSVSFRNVVSIPRGDFHDNLTRLLDLHLAAETRV